MCGSHPAILQGLVSWMVRAVLSFSSLSLQPLMTRRGAGPKLDKLLNSLTQDNMGENTKFLGEVGDSEINMQGPGLINVSSFSS